MNNQPFEYDLFLGGPPDRRCNIPYRQMIKDAFPDLKIYDWESYKGDDYQAKNNDALRASRMMVSMVPDFPMPGIGPEVGYFYAIHEERIRADRLGLALTSPRFGPYVPDEKIERTCPVNDSILIWPEVFTTDTRKTIAQYALLVSSVDEAIAAIHSNLAAINAFNDRHYPQASEKKKQEQAALQTIAIKLHNERQQKLVQAVANFNEKRQREQTLADETLLDPEQTDPLYVNHHPFKKGGPYPGPKKTGL